MALLFVASDGSWGDAEGLRIVDVTPEQHKILNDVGEHEAVDILSELDALVVFPAISDRVRVNAIRDDLIKENR